MVGHEERKCSLEIKNYMFNNPPSFTLICVHDGVCDVITVYTSYKSSSFQHQRSFCACLSHENIINESGKIV